MRHRGLILFLSIAILGAFPACQPGGDDSSPEASTEATYDGPFLLVLNKSSNTLSVVNPLTLQEVKTIPTGFAPHEVTVIDLEAWAVVGEIIAGDEPDGLAWTG